VFICPLAPVYIFGIISQMSLGMYPIVALISMVFMMLTAYSYGSMAQAFPVAGSSYSYVQRSINVHLGFLSGWSMLLDYGLFPLLLFTFSAGYVAEFTSVLPVWAWVGIFVLIVALINIFGIGVTAKANFFIAALQIVALIAFFVYAIIALSKGVGSGEVITPTAVINPSKFDMSLIIGAVAIACINYLGFDAVTTLSEESSNPRKTMRIAPLLVCLVMGSIFFVQVYFGQCLWPDYTSYPNPDQAFFYIIDSIGGTWFHVLFSVAVVVSSIGCCITFIGSCSRILYAMGRDGLLPKKFFGAVHPKYQTPYLNVILIAILAFIGSVFLQIALIASMINYGALFGFMFVNLSVIVHYFVRLKIRGFKGAIKYLIMPLLGFSVCFWLFINLGGTALMVGTCWILVGLIYLAVKTKGFKSLPPEMANIVKNL
ncbi:MAG: APC family permease, partial [Eubacteriales bacterium]|nr:APC family permease [Eubacteriales bacterium]